MPTETWGPSVPADEFRDTLSEVARAAGTGSARVEGMIEAELDFAWTPSGLDVIVRHLEDDNPEAESRVVGDMLYSHVCAWGSDGDVARTAWTYVDLTDQDPTWRFLVANAQALRSLGSPFGLLAAIRGSEAVLIEEGADVRRYRAAIPQGALMRHGMADRDADSSAGDLVEVLWDVDSTGLLNRVQAESTSPVMFEFSGWGTTPAVIAPDGPLLTLLEWEMSLGS